MKRISKIILLAVATLGISSCSDDYLETTPTDQVATPDAFSTVDNAWAALNGLHRIMYSQIFGVQAQGGQSGNMMYMDILGEDVVFTSGSNSWHRSSYQWIDHRNPTSSNVFYNYQFYYVIIGNANMIIANIDGALGAEADKHYIKAQALTYRAWSYFQMVQLFGERFVAGEANNGPGVPIVLEPTTAVTPRNTVAEVYEQISSDLDEAISLFSGYSRANPSHLDISVARGIKARMALTQQNWSLAATLANEARNGYALMSQEEYQAGFNDYSNREWMWGAHLIPDQTNYFYSFFAYMSLNYSSTAIRVNPKAIFSVLYDKISETDVRKTLWDPTGEDSENFQVPPDGSHPPYINRKFRVANPDLSIGDVPFMRAAEMYLIEAEALARNGSDAEAAAVLFELANARDAEYTLSTNTGNDLIDEILIQRRIELWGEGFRFYDLKRTNSDLNRRGGNHNASYAGNVLDIPAGDKRWQYLLPQDEIINTDGVVEQNPQ